MLTYYILDGFISQVRQPCNVFAAQVDNVSGYMADYSTNWLLMVLERRKLYCISKAFTTAASKLEKIGY
ncbi:hypothetical protein LINGRAHAP2_LOCUS4154, partial [Linum grandiflorum]